MIRSYNVPGGDVNWGRWEGGGCGLRLITDQRLHHECVLEVTDVVAVLGLALVDA